jgi:hypothetical protein
VISKNDYVFYTRPLPAQVLEDEDFAEDFSEWYIYYRNERTCGKTLFAKQQGLELVYDDGTDVSAYSLSSNTSAADEDRKDSVCDQECSLYDIPACKGLDFDQMREEWQDDGRLFVPKWE